MSSKGSIYIAGVGLSNLPSGDSSKKTTASLISAATKALLDAGLTYDNVARSVRSKSCRGASEALKAFDEGNVKVDEVGDGSAFEHSFNLIDEKHLPCTLMVDTEKSTAVAVVLVSENFLWSRPYLKDSAARIQKVDAASKSQKQSLHDLCRIVWALRGWSSDEQKTSKGGQRQWVGYGLSRADGNSIPKWKDVEHKQDGKDRLRYNPAKETKGISRYDFEGVRAGAKSKGKDHDWIDFERDGGDRVALAKL